MIKKLLTISIVFIIGLGAMPIATAQQGIDPSLKPINSPDIPATGPGTKEECEKKNGTWDEEAKLCRGFEDEPINAFLQIIGGAILMLSGGIAVIVIGVGGIMYITSRGNQQQLEFAKNTLLYGIIGMLVIIFSYFIIRWVLNIIIGL
ncbi:hypothetical protein GF369_04450 [Candidatus Peregrinibacteria bacterium]|nr:hypothetical protein [Candidatus Peregrinibacteria bacterium]